MTKRGKNNKDDSQPPYSNEQWMELLSEPANEVALQELRRLLVRGLKPALHTYIDRELGQFVQDVAHDGIIKILENLDTFRGESRFMTWAMKIAVREGLTELRRKRWDNISLEDIRDLDDTPDAGTFAKIVSVEKPSPESATAQKMIVEKVDQIIEELLTEHQRKAFEAVVVKGIPSFIVAKELNTNRNNIYKLLYDARKKIKNELEVQGIDSEQLLREVSG